MKLHVKKSDGRCLYCGQQDPISIECPSDMLAAAAELTRLRGEVEKWKRTATTSIVVARAEAAEREVERLTTLHDQYEVTLDKRMRSGGELLARAEAAEREVERQKCEIASLRASLGSPTGAEPIGCPIPGACCAVLLQTALAVEQEKGRLLRAWLNRRHDAPNITTVGRILAHMDALDFPPSTPQDKETE